MTWSRAGGSALQVDYDLQLRAFPSTLETFTVADGNISAWPGLVWATLRTVEEVGVSISLSEQAEQAYPGVGVPSSRVEAVLVPLVRVF